MGFSEQRGSFAEAFEHESFDALRRRQGQRRGREQKERIAEVKRYLKATNDSAAAGFLEMEREDVANTSDPRWRAWNTEGGARRCRDWLEANDG